MIMGCHLAKRLNKTAFVHDCLSVILEARTSWCLSLPAISCLINPSIPDITWWYVMCMYVYIYIYHKSNVAMENSPLSLMIFPLKAQSSSGISQLATFDYRRVPTANPSSSLLRVVVTGDWRSPLLALQRLSSHHCLWSDHCRYGLLDL